MVKNFNKYIQIPFKLHSSLKYSRFKKPPEGGKF